MEKFHQSRSASSENPQNIVMIMIETDMGTSCAITTGDITIAVTVEAVACANTTGSVPNADNVM